MCVLGVLNMTFLSAYLKVSSSVIELTFGVQSQEILQMREPKGSLASSVLSSSAFGDISSLSPFIKLLFGLACVWLVFFHMYLFIRDITLIEWLWKYLGWL